jgi:hypothetical protein
MSEAVEKATRRELRRAVGEEARGIVNEHTALIDNAIIPQLKAHEARQDYHEHQLKKAEERIHILEGLSTINEHRLTEVEKVARLVDDAFKRFYYHGTFWQRLKWVIRGHRSKRG